MDEQRATRGMPVLDPAPGPGGAPGPSQPPRSVPELAPTPLQHEYVYLSVVVLVCGALGITLAETGAGFGHPLVKLAVLVGAPILVLTTADAAVRIWRSAWAWMPVDRGRGLFRLAWLAAPIALISLAAGALIVVLPA